MKISNHTQVSNQFIEDMPNLSGSEVKVGLAVFRKTIGWHKVSDRISYSQMRKITGLSVNALKKAINGLVEKGYISQTDTKMGFRYDLAISENDTAVSENDTPVSKNDTVEYQKMTPQKKDKETNTKEITEYYFKVFEENLGFKPTFNGKHGKIIKNLLKDNSVSDIKKFIDAWMDGIGEWCGYDICNIGSSLNKIKMKMQGAAPSAPQGKRANF